MNSFPEVPKIIWQTHNYKYEELPEHFKKATRTWINLNPDWEYRYVDNEERDHMIAEYYPDLHSSYSKIQYPKDLPKVFDPYKKGLMESDIWKMLILYKFGGVYADMDSICVKPLNYELEGINGHYEAFVVPDQIEPNGNKSVNCANFAVIKNSSGLKNVVEEVFNENFINLRLNEWITPWNSFSKNLVFSDTAYKNFKAADHSKDFKDDFYYKDVNYYGAIINYKDLLTKLNLEA